jgi:exonuclease-1
MKSLTVSEDYRNAFLLADAAFRYQLVFDPLSCSLVHLNEPEDSEKVTAYAGKMLPSDIAYQLALGNLNPFTLEQVDNFNPHVVQQACSYVLSICRSLIFLTFEKEAYFVR